MSFSSRGGRSSSSSHFSQTYETVTAGKAEDTFYGITLSNNILAAPTWQIVVFSLLVLAIIFQPLIISQKRRDLVISYWIGLLSISIAIPQTTWIPLLTTIIYTRTSYPYLVVIPHCIVSVATYRIQHTTDNKQDIHYIQSLFGSFFLYGFGGSILSDIFMGLPVTALSHTRIIPTYVLSYIIVWFSPYDYVYQHYIRQPQQSTVSAMSLVLKIFEAIDAVTTPMGRVSRSARELQNKVSAPIMAGIFAGFGGCSIRYICKEPTTTISTLETIFWKTVWYSILWWIVAVDSCDNQYFINNWLVEGERNHCESYNGSDLVRVILVVIHTIWTLLGEIGIVTGHPFVWITKDILLRQVGSQLVNSLKLGPSYQNNSLESEEGATRGDNTGYNTRTDKSSDKKD